MNTTLRKFNNCSSPYECSAQASKRGFTLVEVIFTIAILSIGLLAYIRSNIAMTQSTELAYEQTVAFYDAQQVVEQIRETAQNGSYPSNVLQAFPDGQEVQGFSNLTDEVITVDYNSVEAPLDFTVNVGWQGNGTRPMSKSVRTIVSKRTVETSDDADEDGDDAGDDSDDESDDDDDDHGDDDDDDHGDDDDDDHGDDHDDH